MPTNPYNPDLDHDTLREIVNGTAGEIGEEFFDMLVQHLARAMGTTCAWVTEWIEDERRLRALSFGLKIDMSLTTSIMLPAHPASP